MRLDPGPAGPRPDLGQVGRLPDSQAPLGPQPLPEIPVFLELLKYPAAELAGLTEQAPLAALPPQALFVAFLAASLVAKQAEPSAVALPAPWLEVALVANSAQLACSYQSVAPAAVATLPHPVAALELPALLDLHLY